MLELTENVLSHIRPIFLEMLVEIDRICKKNNINYSIDSGTLLGAVRAGKFIPWDDDADVTMLRSDYEKFVSACDKDLDKERFFLQDMYSDHEYRWGYPKLRYNNSAFVRGGQEHGKWHQGVFVDIFVYDGVPDNYILRRIHLFICYCIRKGLYSVIGKKSGSNALWRLWYKMVYLIPRTFWVKSLEFMIIISNMSEHKLVRHLTYPYRQEAKYGMPRICFDEYGEIELEGHIFKCYKDYDKFLVAMYGDYMVLPPKEDRHAGKLSILKINGIEIMED